MKSVIQKLIIIFITLNHFYFIRDCNASKKYNRYLAHIFNKYGNGGALSFEGLEHLMYNLGLGGLEFNVTHTIDEHHPDGYKIPDLEFGEDNALTSSVTKNKNDESSKKNDQNVNVKFKSNINDRNSQIINNQNNENYNNFQIENDQIEITKYDSNNNEKQKLQDIEIDLSNIGLIHSQSDITETGSDKNFKEMHDPKHRHPRHQSNENTASDNKCLSPKSLMKLVVDHDDLHQQFQNIRINPPQGHSISKRYTINDDSSNKDKSNNHDEEEEYNEFISSVRITPETFMKLCPALLVQIDQDACAQNIEEEHKNAQEYAYSWIYATIAVFIISCCGLIGIAIVPLIKSVAYNEILKFLVAIAIGTLCGDALMHLMPHALINEHHNEINNEKQSSNHNNEPVWLCSCAFLTALFMYSLETLLPLLKGANNDHGHGHSHHNHAAQLKTHQQQQQHQQQQNPTNIDMEIMRRSINLDPKEINVMLNESKEDKKGTQLTPVAFMVVLGDGLHNLTDGLAIGAAFASDPVTGMATAFAVLCHELPHELGDFALLLQTGLNIKRAIFLNIVSSVLSFIGMAIGLFVAGMHSNMVRWIYASTAGSFLYIAFADLIPEMGRSGEKNFQNSLIQISGILLGGVIMILIALNEDTLRLLFE